MTRRSGLEVNEDQATHQAKVLLAAGKLHCFKVSTPFFMYMYLLWSYLRSLALGYFKLITLPLVERSYPAREIFAQFDLTKQLHAEVFYQIVTGVS